MKKLYIKYLGVSLILLLLLPIFLPIDVHARAPRRHNYVGVEMCEICHKKKELGDQYVVWTNTSHSKAFYTLGTPEAKKVADRMGIEDPQQNSKCLRCHATCYGITDKTLAEDLRVEDGVQCESCHGPGEEYMYLEVMEDLKDAKSMGLVMPTEETCRKCHNPESPTWDPERDTTPDGTKTGFNFSLRWKMIEHHKPLKETKK